MHSENTPQLTSAYLRNTRVLPTVVTSKGRRDEVYYRYLL